jgi:hypothetical protein
MNLTAQGQVHFSAAFGDVDNDGDLDLFVVVAQSKIATGPGGGGFDLLYENLLGNKDNWLEFRLKGVQSNRSAIGARIRCVAGNLSQIREVNSGFGYHAMNPLEQHFGFGQRTVVDSVIIRWPSGKIDKLLRVPVNQILNITEGSTTSVGSEVVMPEKMELVGNYPNPFNSTTIIRFTLPKLQRVRLEVVDVTGRHVRTLVDDRLLSGVHEVRWNGRDDSDRPVGSGIYFCRLMVEGFVQTRVMALVK